jgi:hypothetical protein
VLVEHQGVSSWSKKKKKKKKKEKLVVKTRGAGHPKELLFCSQITSEVQMTRGELSRRWWGTRVVEDD